MNHTKACLLLFVLAILAACAAEDEQGITVAEAWARPSPMVVDNGAIYLDITNHTDEAETLVAVSSPACAATELHTMRMTADDVMVMAPLADGLTLPAGTTTHLEPGSQHIMCLGKKVDFAEGETLAVTLTFAAAEPLVVTATVTVNSTAQK